MNSYDPVSAASVPHLPVGICLALLSTYNFKLSHLPAPRQWQSHTLFFLDPGRSLRRSFNDGLHIQRILAGLLLHAGNAKPLHAGLPHCHRQPSSPLNYLHSRPLPQSRPDLVVWDKLYSVQLFLLECLWSQETFCMQEKWFNRSEKKDTLCASSGPRELTALWAMARTWGTPCVFRAPACGGGLQYTPRTGAVHLDLR